MKIQTEKEFIQAEACLRTLEAQGMDVKAMWRELALARSAQDLGKMSEVDGLVALPEVAPNIEAHLEGGQPQVLCIDKLWEGYSYSLSKGQRRLLRERYGMTPSATMTCRSIVRWPETQFPRFVQLVSDVHIDPRLRRHVLSSVFLREVGKFFVESQRIDTEEAAVVKVASLTETSLSVGRQLKLETEDRWAIADLTDVDVGTHVEVLEVEADSFVLFEKKTDACVRVKRVAFFETVKEYRKLYGVKAKKASAVEHVPDALDALVAKLMAVKQ